MTILFVGSEPGDFDELDFSGTDTGSVESGDLSRCAVEIRGGSDEFVSAKFSASAEVCARARVVMDHAEGDIADGYALIELRADGSPVAGIIGDDEKFKAAYHDGENWVFVEEVEGVAFNEAGANFPMVHVKDGGIEWYLNEGLVASEELDTSDYGDIDEVRIFVTTSGLSFNQVYVSEVIAADFSLRGHRLRTVELDGNGEKQDWDGSVEDINACDTPESDIISSDTAGEVSTFTLKRIAEADFEDLDVQALILKASIQREGGPDEVAGVVRVDGENYETGQAAPESTWDNHQFVWETNPETGQAWTNDEIDNAELGLVTRDV
ncbi:MULTISPECIES: hypothetical protein [unclassified Thioalkalivibrio]|uniref:hypothetical protein n=1 Tax=unclassified Thioalkalivibrio TaxID=2621013 RepID=UPI00037DB419|nr:MULTISPECIES: hypothetical protein [unclassified Thioalkalivibrio]